MSNSVVKDIEEWRMTTIVGKTYNPTGKQKFLACMHSILGFPTTWDAIIPLIKKKKLYLSEYEKLHRK